MYISYTNTSTNTTSTNTCTNYSIVLILTREFASAADGTLRQNKILNTHHQPLSPSGVFRQTPSAHRVQEPPPRAGRTKQIPSNQINKIVTARRLSISTTRMPASRTVAEDTQNKMDERNIVNKLHCYRSVPFVKHHLDTGRINCRRGQAERIKINNKEA